MARVRARCFSPHRADGRRQGEGLRHPRYIANMSIPRARALRQTATDAERRLWLRLRDRQLDGWKFKRQCPIGNFVADFACREAWLVVELDGGQHNIEADSARTTALEQSGWRVLRFWNDEVLRNADGVLRAIAAALATAAAWRRRGPDLE